MIKKESSQQKVSKSCACDTTNMLLVPMNEQKENIALSRIEFLSWAKNLATQQRYVALRLAMPQVVASYRRIGKKILDLFKEELVELKKPIFKNFKILEQPYQTFLDSIVFMTDEEYLDSVGFDYTYVENPEKIYDLLMIIKKCGARKTQKRLQQELQISKKQSLSSIVSREDWIISAATEIQRALIVKIYDKWEPKVFEDEKNHKKDFVAFWKNMDEQQRQMFLRLGCQDPKKLQAKLNQLGVHVRAQQIQFQICDFIKADKKQLCNRIFKWKAKKNNPFICNYYQILFNRWKQIEKLSKSKKKYHGKKKSKKNKRQKSLDAMSNQTNQTEIKSEKFEINIKQIAIQKLQRDIYCYSDQISELANSYFQRRVLAFQRLKYLLQPYDIKIKLYGSCACGIAIENSDLDVAVDDGILDSFDYLPTVQKRVQQVLLSIQQILSSVSFTSDIKSISSAYIPIIKFKIDTNPQFYCEDPYLYSHLNRNISLGGTVQIDLTIQTKSQCTSSTIKSPINNSETSLSPHSPQSESVHTIECSESPQSISSLSTIAEPQTSVVHLGIKSTDQIKMWLQQYPTLRPILLILKYQLTLNSLHQTYSAGLNTYTLIIMLVAVYRKLQILPSERIGTVLQKILRFWGWQFQQNINGINIETEDIIYNKNNKDNTVDFHTKISAELQIQDPLNHGKIMTKNCYKFTQIRQLFKCMYNQCILKTHERVEEICSIWNPKQQKYNCEQLSEWVLGQLKDNEFEKLVT